jgi:hypothetical protein
MKLFLPVSSSLDCSKIQSYLDRSTQWCDDNGLSLKSANAKLCLDLSHLFDSHIRIERIQEKFVKYAHRRLEWDASFELARRALINLDTM